MIYSIIVTYNGKDWIKRCLDSIRENNVDQKIVVIDNNSQDETVEIIKSEYPEVHLIESKENLGFGRSCNIGIKYALDTGAEYMFVINQDAKFFPDAMKELLDIANQHQEYGMLTPINLNDDGTDIDSEFLRHLIKSSKQYLSDMVLGKVQKVYDAPFLPGAVWLVKRDLFEDVGVMDPIYFLYGVDIDFYERIRARKWKTGFVPSAKIYHSYYRGQIMKWEQKPVAARVYEMTWMAMVRLKDPHHSFFKNVTFFLAKCGYISIRGIVTLRFSDVWVAVRTFFQILPKLFTIFNNRRKGMKMKGAFLDDIVIPV